MSRWDLTGIFWDDYVPPKIAKVKEKRTPPEPTWLSPDYLPDLDEARAYVFDLASTRDLLDAQAANHRLVWDTEFYPNISLLGFRDMVTGKITKFELNDNGTLSGTELDKFKWVLGHFLVVGFNDTNFDIPMAMATAAGFGTERLAHCAERLIHGGEFNSSMRPFEFYREQKIKPFHVNNIDLIELTPLGPSLKICAGRLHAPRMADLPYPPGTFLSEDQKTILRWYWANDLSNTQRLYEKHKTAIELREILTSEYQVDVRSKSDPQIAEQVIRKEIQRITGEKYLKRAEIRAGAGFLYRPPAYLQYQSPTMQWVLDFIRKQPFRIDQYGSPTETDELHQLTVPIGDAIYKMGIGGLHSQEKKQIHVAGDEIELTDNDVTSYYPSLIIQQGMYPPNVGPVFLKVFKRIYDRRLAAKRSGDKATAETLKIVLNGTFGKTGERGGYSVVYYPEMMIQVTLTGQLALLMLIERLELAHIPVVSANTDGIVVKCPKSLSSLRDAIMRQWEQETGLELESKAYKAIYSRDVNNYIALLEKPDERETDGFRFAKSIGAYRKTLDTYPMKWNPTCDVCQEAVIAFLANGTPVDETIRACTDIRKFIEVRRVTGGAVKDGIYLGKAIRWYYAKDVTSAIINASNGYDVPRSQGAKPCMVLPTCIPDDLDYDYYVERALAILEKDFTPKAEQEPKEKAA